MVKKIMICLMFILALVGCSDDDDIVVVDDNGELSLQQIANDSANVAVWVPRLEMKSRNGDDMGYGTLLNPDSDQLLIFLDGGGACFNGLTCAFNLDAFSEDDFYLRLATEESLLLNRTSDSNQFKDWNVIFVPYATGDVHVGSNAMVDIPNGGPNNQMMVGATNFNLILNDLNEYFSNNGGISEIVFAGSSAGGFGIMPNYFQLKDKLGENIPTTAIIDAGQIFKDTNLLTPCLVDDWNSLWNISASLPTDLNAVVQNPYEYDIQKVYEYAAVKYPNDNFGFLSYYQDATNTFFYGFGQNDCAYPPTGPISGTDFEDGLMDLKTNVLDDLSNWKVFYKSGNSHVFLNSSDFSQTVNGTTLNQWINDLRLGIAEDLAE